ncbi:VCBS domain-containing protein [Ramlibacter sp. AW1]|uniref:VCBS domain-containing protein n=1 Tax=Ramlibacter aurantiacus TaxID=2801330 RepID=A0A936ZMB2_9BURK|nr:VCBS domain-containing protein [Ramlibacter aurantiacus]MBL0422803.1 VCBS domain-containing protein [Ramlibacter aurantiacus]
MTTSTSTFLKGTPDQQAYLFDEAALLESGLLEGNIVTLDVVTDGSADLYSVGSVMTTDTATAAQLVKADKVDRWQELLGADGLVIGMVRINADHTVDLDLTISLQRLGVSSVAELQAGQEIRISFAYATRRDADGKPDDWNVVSFTLTGQDPQTNQPPVAHDDDASGNENDVLTIAVLANDFDPEGGPLQVVQASCPAGQGSVTIVDNQLVFDPGTDFDHLPLGGQAKVEVTYTVRDSQGAESSATVTVGMVGTNDAPVAMLDGVAGDENQPLTIDVLANDRDPDGDPLELVSVTQPAEGWGTVSMVGNRLVFTPGTALDQLAEGNRVAIPFSYVVRDRHGAESTAVVTVFILATNDAPVLSVVHGEPSQTVRLGSSDPWVAQGQLSLLDADSANVAVSVELDQIIGATLSCEQREQLAALMQVNYTGTTGSPTPQPVNWTFSAIGSDAFSFLAEGQAILLNYVVRASDGSEQDEQVLSITVVRPAWNGITGKDHGVALLQTPNPLDGARLFDDSGTLEGETSLFVSSGQLEAYDAEGNWVGFLGVRPVDTQEGGTFTVDQDGFWTYTRPDDGRTFTDSFTVHTPSGLSHVVTVDVGRVPDTQATAGADFLVAALGDGSGWAPLDGGAGNDHLLGTSGADWLIGADGDDRLDAGDSGVTHEYLDGGTGDDLMYGESGPDGLVGGEGNDRLFGGAGNDSLYGDEGDDRLFGGDDDDLLDGDSGQDVLFGGRGNDTLLGGEGRDVLFGGDGNDLLSGGAGSDVLHGGDGDDRLRSSERGTDLLLGGRGDDQLIVGSPAWGMFRGGFPSDQGPRFTVMDGGPGHDVLQLGDHCQAILLRDLDGLNDVRGFDSTEDFILVDTSIFTGLLDADGHLDPGRWVTTGDAPEGPHLSLASRDGADGVSWTLNYVDRDGTVHTVALFDAAPNLDRVLVSGTDHATLYENHAPVAAGQLAQGTESWQALSPLVTAYGEFQFDSKTGKWLYVLDNESPAVDALRAGESYVDRLIVQRAGQEPISIAITIHGRDTAMDGQTDYVINAGSAHVLRGTLQTLNVDAEPSGLRFLPEEAEATFGTFTFDQLTGDWSYRLRPDADPTEARQDTLTITSADGDASMTVTVNVLPRGTTERVFGDDYRYLTQPRDGNPDIEPQVAHKGQLEAVDLASGERVAFVAAEQDGFSINATGAWTYLQPAALFQAGRVEQAQFVVRTVNGTEHVITVTIDLDGVPGLIGGYDGETYAYEGGPGADVLLLADHGPYPVRFTGDADNDYVEGGSGDLRARGGTGDDTLVGGAQVNLLDGGDGNDVLRGGESVDWLGGGAGDDTLVAGRGATSAWGGAGSDLLSAGAGRSVSLHGEDGDDFLFGGSGRGLLDGGAGSDLISTRDSSGSAVYALDGGAGDNVLRLGSGSDTLWVGTLDGKQVVHDFDPARDFILIDAEAIGALPLVIGTAAAPDTAYLLFTRDTGTGHDTLFYVPAAGDDGRAPVALVEFTTPTDLAAAHVRFASGTQGDVFGDGAPVTGGMVAAGEWRVDLPLGERELPVFAGAVGHFDFDAATGRWLYILDADAPALADLAPGEVITERLVLRSPAGPDPLEITVTVHASAGSTLPRASIVGVDIAVATEFKEPDVVQVSGQLHAIDWTTGKPVAFRPITEGPFTIDASGAWSFRDGAANHADVTTLSFDVFATDGTAHTVTVIIEAEPAGGSGYVLYEHQGWPLVDHQALQASGPTNIVLSADMLWTQRAGVSRGEFEQMVVANSLAPPLLLVAGSAGNDTLIAGPAHAEFRGGAGDDVLIGSSRPVFLLGGDGNDRLFGGSGGGLLDGGAGDDWISTWGARGGDRGGAATTVDGGAGANTIQLGDGNDTLRISTLDGLQRVSNFGSGRDLVLIDIDGIDLGPRGPDGTLDLLRIVTDPDQAPTFAHLQLTTLENGETQLSYVPAAAATPDGEFDPLRIPTVLAVFDSTSLVSADFIRLAEQTSILGVDRAVASDFENPALLQVNGQLRAIDWSTGKPVAFQPITEGPFTIDATGAWSYAAAAEEPGAATEVSELPFVVFAVDGTAHTVTVIIDPAGVAATGYDLDEWTDWPLGEDAVVPLLSEGTVVLGSDFLWGNAGATTEFFQWVIAEPTANPALVLDGSAGADTLVAGPGAVQLRGNGGRDTLVGSTGTGVLSGGGGDDRLLGGTGGGILAGGAGDDQLSTHGGDANSVFLVDGGSGWNTIRLGAGTDLLWLGSNGGLQVVSDFDAASDKVVIDPATFALAAGEDGHLHASAFRGLDAVSFVDGPHLQFSQLDDGTGTLMYMPAMGDTSQPTVLARFAPGTVLTAENILLAGGNQVVEDGAGVAAGTVEAGAWEYLGTGGEWGSLHLDASTGQWIYLLDNAAAQLLGEGVTRQDVLTLQGADGSLQDITVTVTGTNDLPTVTGRFVRTVSYAEGMPPPTVQGVFFVSDPDEGESGLARTGEDPLLGVYGSLSVWTDGNWTYQLYEHVAPPPVGESLQDQFDTLQTLDGTTIDALTILVTGTTGGGGGPEV